jgi:hypothetical protein
METEDLVVEEWRLEAEKRRQLYIIRKYIDRIISLLCLVSILHCVCRLTMVQTFKLESSPKSL